MNQNTHNFAHAVCPFFVFCMFVFCIVFKASSFSQNTHIIFVHAFLSCVPQFFPAIFITSVCLSVWDNSLENYLGHLLKRRFYKCLYFWRTRSVENFSLTASHFVGNFSFCFSVIRLFFGFVCFVCLFVCLPCSCFLRFLRLQILTVQTDTIIATMKKSTPPDNQTNQNFVKSFLNSE